MTNYGLEAVICLSFCEAPRERCGAACARRSRSSTFYDDGMKCRPPRCQCEGFVECGLRTGRQAHESCGGNIYIDCTETLRVGANTGIQRTVRSMLRAGREISGGLFVPVAFDGVHFVARGCSCARRPRCARGLDTPCASDCKARSSPARARRRLRATILHPALQSVARRGASAGVLGITRAPRGVPRVAGGIHGRRLARAARLHMGTRPAAGARARQASGRPGLRGRIRPHPGPTPRSRITGSGAGVLALACADVAARRPNPHDLGVGARRRPGISRAGRC
jgi:hypothetical protein